MLGAVWSQDLPGRQQAHNCVCFKTKPTIVQGDLNLVPFGSGVRGLRPDDLYFRFDIGHQTPDALTAQS